MLGTSNMSTYDHSVKLRLQDEARQAADSSESSSINRQRDDTAESRHTKSKNHTTTDNAKNTNKVHAINVTTKLPTLPVLPDKQMSFQMMRFQEAANKLSRKKKRLIEERIASRPESVEATTNNNNNKIYTKNSKSPEIALVVDCDSYERTHARRPHVTSSTIIGLPHFLEPAVDPHLVATSNNDLRKGNCIVNNDIGRFEEGDGASDSSPSSQSLKAGRRSEHSSSVDSFDDNGATTVRSVRRSDFY